MTRPEHSATSKTSKRRRSTRRNGAGGTLLGVFIGLVLGLGLASGVAYYLMKGPVPFTPVTGSRDVREPVRESGKTAKADAGSEKPRFDFYKILPGVEEPKVQAEKKGPDRAVAEQPKEPPTDKVSARIAEKPAGGDRPPEKAHPAVENLAKADPAAGVKAAERFWLQAGSFSVEADAENLKARLAFSGWQAQVLRGTMPDKAVRYRVRLGPYDNTAELNRVKGELAKAGFDVAVLRN